MPGLASSAGCRRPLRTILLSALLVAARTDLEAAERSASAHDKTSGRSAIGASAATVTPEEARGLIPWNELSQASRSLIEDVVNNPTVFHRSQSEVFECTPDVYLLLLHQPVLTMELWKSLGLCGANLEEVAPDHFRGSDARACKGSWQFVYKSPELHVIYCEGEYRGPLLATTLETRSVLVLRTVFIEERGKTYVKHQIDGYVRAEAGTLKTAARVLRPVFQRSVEATMQEVLWFVSLMCRYSVYDPHTIAQATAHADRVSDSVKTSMQSALHPLLAASPPRRPEPTAP
jgi:hypothetical protein